MDPNDTATNFNNQFGNILAGVARAVVVVVGTGIAVVAATAGAPVTATVAGAVALIALFTTPASAATCGTVGGSFDPNDKLGPAGWAEERYYRPERGAPYTIRFENLDTATFPAQEVVVVDTLDSSVFDLSTFSLGPIRWGEDGEILPPPGAQRFEAEVSLAPEFDATLLLTAGLDRESGQATWSFVTLDNQTGDLPEDGTVGFLPPNAMQPEGEGSVSFVIDTRPGLPTGTAVSNQAEIVFDVNESIVTPLWTNTVDVTPPASSVDALGGSSQAPFEITISASDPGAGVHLYRLYAQQGSGPFEVVAESNESTLTFSPPEAGTYGFYSRTVDHLGNEEGPKTQAEATTMVAVAGEGAPDLPASLTLEAPRPNPARGTVRLRYGLPSSGEMRVRVVDLLGREVAVLAEGETPAGWHMAEWTPSVAAGVYAVEIRAGDEVRHQRVTIVR